MELFFKKLQLHLHVFMSAEVGPRGNEFVLKNSKDREEEKILRTFYTQVISSINTTALSNQIHFLIRNHFFPGDFSLTTSSQAVVFF